MLKYIHYPSDCPLWGYQTLLLLCHSETFCFQFLFFLLKIALKQSAAKSVLSFFYLFLC